ncbi:MAG: hypothetical protein GY795_04375, partial [Desulfobacterales bacterium]|nr:hypothetical protein [Desulfobacterales bacterium]
MEWEHFWVSQLDDVVTREMYSPRTSPKDTSISGSGGNPVSKRVVHYVAQIVPDSKVIWPEGRYLDSEYTAACHDLGIQFILRIFMEISSEYYRPNSLTNTCRVFMSLPEWICRKENLNISRRQDLANKHLALSYKKNFIPAQTHSHDQLLPVAVLIEIRGCVLICFGFYDIWDRNNTEEEKQGRKTLQEATEAVNVQPSGSGTELTSSAISGKDVSVPGEIQQETEEQNGTKKSQNLHRLQPGHRWRPTERISWKKIFHVEGGKLISDTQQKQNLCVTKLAHRDAWLTMLKVAEKKPGLEKKPCKPSGSDVSAMSDNGQSFEKLWNASGSTVDEDGDQSKCCPETNLEKNLHQLDAKSKVEESELKIEEQPSIFIDSQANGQQVILLKLLPIQLHRRPKRSLEQFQQFPTETENIVYRKILDTNVPLCNIRLRKKFILKSCEKSSQMILRNWTSFGSYFRLL